MFGGTEERCRSDPATWRGRVPCNEDTVATAAKEIRGRYNGNDNGCVAVGYSAASRLASLAADWLIHVGSIAGKHSKFACNLRLRHTRYTEHFAKHRFPLTVNTCAPSVPISGKFSIDSAIALPPITCCSDLRKGASSPRGEWRMWTGETEERCK